MVRTEVSKLIKNNFSKDLSLEKINPKFSDKVSRMEIFGPVVNIYSYDNLEKTIDIANDTSVSFQASIFY